MAVYRWELSRAQFFGHDSFIFFLVHTLPHGNLQRSLVEFLTRAETTLKHYKHARASTFAHSTRWANHSDLQNLMNVKIFFDSKRGSALERLSRESIMLIIPARMSLFRESKFPQIPVHKAQIPVERGPRLQ